MPGGFDMKNNKKWPLFLLCIFLDIAAVSLIPVNALVVNFDMPEFATVIASLAAIASTVLFFAKIKKAGILKSIICFLSVLTVAVSIFGSYCNPYWNSVVFRTNVDYRSKPYDYRLRSRDAVKDLEYAMKYLRKLHPALYHGTPEDINRQYRVVKNRIEQRSDISKNELAGEIESVLSVLRDGHTFVRGVYNDKIVKYYRKWTDAGYRITAVNGITTDELLELKKSYYSYEVPSWMDELMSYDIVTEAGLDYLGFDIGNGIVYTLASADGSVRTGTCYPDDFITVDEYRRLYSNDDTAAAENNFVSYEIDEENNIAILRLEQCTYNDEYISCLRSMFEEVKEKKIGNVAVDLRGNGGGSSQVVDEFFRYLDIDSYRSVTLSWRLGFVNKNMGNGISENKKYEDLLFHGDLYLLTSARTFSSAMMFAQYVKDNRLGIIIGEAPGNDPNGYGEVSCFMLPNSGLYMQISTKRFYRADRESTDELVYPDIECSSKLAMEELYRLIKEK